jgi:hypothetical protein
MRILFSIIFLGCAFISKAQTKDFFSADSLRADLSVLASDSFKGRNTLSPEIKKAAEFISGNFKQMNLRRLNNGPSYYTPFIIGNPTKQQLKINGDIVAPSQYYAFSVDDVTPTLSEKEIRIHTITANTEKELLQAILNVLSDKSPSLVQLSEEQTKLMSIIEDNAQIIREKLQSFLIIYPTNESIKTIDLRISKEAEARLAYNVVGVLPGKKFPSEYVIISAHYDHVGFKKSQHEGEDTIFNGANDNASGVTAMLAFAKYLSFKNDNARTVIFIAFTGEELGLLGSKFLSLRMDVEKIKAMFNLEMLGKPDDTDQPRLLMTGDEYSNLFTVAKKYVKGIKFERDRYPEQKLHARSDHFPFFSLGVVAHTFMYYSPLDRDYHKVTDDILTIDFPNFSNTLHALLPAFEAIISGKETPKLRN